MPKFLRGFHGLVASGPPIYGLGGRSVGPCSKASEDASASKSTVDIYVAPLGSCNAGDGLTINTVNEGPSPSTLDCFVCACCAIKPRSSLISMREDLDGDSND